MAQVLIDTIGNWLSEQAIATIYLAYSELATGGLGDCPQEKFKYTIYLTYSELTTCEGIKKIKYTVCTELAASPAFARCSRRRPRHATPA